MSGFLMPINPSQKARVVCDLVTEFTPMEIMAKDTQVQEEVHWKISIVKNLSNLLLGKNQVTVATEKNFRQTLRN